MVAKKNRILYVKRFLEEQADEAHPAVVTDIVAFLADEGITANRKTVAQDIEQLIEAGVGVVCNVSRPNKYFIGDRHFEIPELKLLIDAAQASNFLTAKRSKALIDKLLALGSCHQAMTLTDGLHYDHQVKPKTKTPTSPPICFSTPSARKGASGSCISNTAQTSQKHINITGKYTSSAHGDSFGIATDIILSVIRKPRKSDTIPRG